MPASLSKWRATVKTGGILLIAGMLAGCAGGVPATGINDPFEPVNRGVHNFNRGVDRNVYRPVSSAYGVIVHKRVRDSVSNFSRNADAPAEIVNSALQADLGGALHSTFRFIINTSLGVLGLFDPASDFGLEERDTDFGETLFVWGVAEGPLLEMPFFGPYTTRHLTGDAVDLVLNPLSIISAPPESFAPTVAWVGENANERYEFSDTFDQILYESADSYAQARQIYLENRRFDLGQVAEESAVDPYEELFGE